MYSSTESVYKKKRSPNRMKKMKTLVQRAIILAVALSVIAYLVAKRTHGPNDNSTDWMNSDVGMKIVSNEKLPSQKYYENVQFIAPRTLKGQRDWHDQAAMEADSKREGHGEQGKPTFLENTYKYKGQDLLKEYGLNTAVADVISINRSVPDIRKLRCLEKRYISDLPSVSIIIVCQHEYPSVFKRTLHSIVNRTPRKLLTEIIIVHMYDDRTFWRNLEKYANLKFPGLLKFIYLSKPQNLVLARQKGAQLATADVLVFFSALVECNYNWLPPLLEPIAFKEQTVTLPVNDLISDDTFAYKANEDANRRVGFDWDLNQEYLPLLLPSDADKTAPYKDIIMSGEIFAVERNFFWTLGGFDEGVSNYADELYEFSFKTWMCGGQILTVPCSHVGVVNLQREAKLKRREEHKKRIAEIWLDDYKNYVYSGVPKLYEAIDPGDLTKQKALRQSLNCRPFEWFLKAVAPDMLEINPPIHKPDLAWGMLRLATYPELCIDSSVYDDDEFTGVNLCTEEDQQPVYTQNWRFSWRGNIQLLHRNLCLEVFEPPPNTTVYLTPCHYQGDSQTWLYDREQKYLVHKKYDDACLDIVEKSPNWKIVINECDPHNVGMRWAFDNIDEVAMKAFEETFTDEGQWLN